MTRSPQKILFLLPNTKITSFLTTICSIKDWFVKTFNMHLLMYLASIDLEKNTGQKIRSVSVSSLSVLQQTQRLENIMKICI